MNPSAKDILTNDRRNPKALAMRRAIPCCATRAAKRTDAAQNAKPTPVQVKVGISDGINTEITEGLTEGQQVVIGIISTGENTAARPANPFGGGMRRF